MVMATVGLKVTMVRVAATEATLAVGAIVAAVISTAAVQAEARPMAATLVVQPPVESCTRGIRHCCTAIDPH